MIRKCRERRQPEGSNELAGGPVVPHLLSPRPWAGQVFVGLDLGPFVVHQVTGAAHGRLARGFVLPVAFAGTETKIRFPSMKGTLLKHEGLDKQAYLALEQ